jgi:hypothetical protein
VLYGICRRGKVKIMKISLRIKYFCLFFMLAFCCTVFAAENELSSEPKTKNNSSEKHEPVRLKPEKIDLRRLKVGGWAEWRLNLAKLDSLSFMDERESLSKEKNITLRLIVVGKGKKGWKVRLKTAVGKHVEISTISRFAPEVFWKELQHEGRSQKSWLASFSQEVLTVDGKSISCKKETITIESPYRDGDDYKFERWFSVAPALGPVKVLSDEISVVLVAFGMGGEPAFPYVNNLDGDKAENKEKNKNKGNKKNG